MKDKVQGEVDVLKIERAEKNETLSRLAETLKEVIEKNKAERKE